MSTVVFQLVRVNVTHVNHGVAAGEVRAARVDRGVAATEVHAARVDYDIAAIPGYAIRLNIMAVYEEVPKFNNRDDSESHEGNGNEEASNTASTYTPKKYKQKNMFNEFVPETNNNIIQVN